MTPKKTVGPDGVTTLDYRPQTAAEAKLEAGITTAGVLLDSREFVKLEGLLSKLALDARSLALLGPEGAQSIPVDYKIPIDYTPGPGSDPIVRTVRVDGPTGSTRYGSTTASPTGPSPAIRVLWDDRASEFVEREFVTFLTEVVERDPIDEVEAYRG